MSSAGASAKEIGTLAQEAAVQDFFPASDSPTQPWHVGLCIYGAIMRLPPA